MVIKNIRLKLNEREVRLKKAQEIAKLGFYTYNYNTKKWTISKIILELIGYPNDNAICKSWLLIIHPNDRKMVIKAFKKIHKPLDLIYRVYNNADGSLRWIHHVTNPFKEDSKIAFLIFEDIRLFILRIVGKLKA